MADLTKKLEELLAKSEGGKYVLRLYVAGSTPQSSRAIQTMEQVCKTSLKDRCELSVVDLYQQPELAKAAQILAAPTADIGQGTAPAVATAHRRTVKPRTRLAGSGFETGRELSHARRG